MSLAIWDLRPTQVNTHIRPNLTPARGRYSIYLRQMDGVNLGDRLHYKYQDGLPADRAQCTAGSRTHNL